MDLATCGFAMLNPLITAISALLLHLAALTYVIVLQKISVYPI